MVFFSSLPLNFVVTLLILWPLNVLSTHLRLFLFFFCFLLLGREVIRVGRPCIFFVSTRVKFKVAFLVNPYWRTIYINCSKRKKKFQIQKFQKLFFCWLPWITRWFSDPLLFLGSDFWCLISSFLKLTQFNPSMHETYVFRLPKNKKRKGNKI